MKTFSRSFNETIEITIRVDYSIWAKEKNTLKLLLRSFKQISDSTNQFNSDTTFLIFDKDSSLSKEINCPYSYICNPKYDNWFFLLIQKLEEFYSLVLKSTVIHGSCVKINGKTILLIGTRHSGKTTLTQFLSIEKKGKYLDDDCIYILNGSYYGFNMPLPMRNKPSNSLDKYYMCQTVDSDGFQRFLYYPPRCISSIEKIDTVIFPKYIQNGKCLKRKLTKGEAYDLVLNNIRSYKTMATIFNDIKNLINTSDSFYIEYPNSNAAYHMLFKGSD